MGITRRLAVMELPLALIALTALIAAEVWVTGNSSVVSHPMWLDENVTSLLLNDPSPRHMLAAVHGGVDTNGPAFYMMVWPVVHALGGSISQLRIISAGMMVLALTGIYAACRCFVEPGRAAIGTLAAATHPLVLVQMWQVRMYGFWLAAVAWFCLYTVAMRGRQSWALRIVGCVLAMLVVTAHWLGVIALVLVSCAALAESRGDASRRWDHVIPLVAGLTALALCAPLIESQRHAMSVATWIAPASMATVAAQLRGIVLVPGSLILAGYGLARMLARRESAMEWGGAVAVVAVLPVVALFLFPGALIAMSIGMQSVLVQRYMIPVVVPIGLVTALATLPLKRRVEWRAGGLAAVALIVMGGMELNALRRATIEDDRRASLVIDIVQRSLAARRPVVFARRFEAYPLIQSRPEWADSVKILDFSGMPDGLMPRTYFERDLGRAVARFYGQYHLVTAEQLRDRGGGGGAITVVEYSAEEDELRRMLPGFRVRRVGANEYVAEPE